MPSGYIYILSNPAMPGLLKIGRTDRSPESRARELRTTGVPHAFVLEHCVQVEDSIRAEAQVHQLLQSNGARMLPDREFFNVRLDEAVEALALVAQADPQPPDFSQRENLARLAATVRTPVAESDAPEEKTAAALQLAAIARRGYPPAMKQAAELFDGTSRSGPHFKQFWREYLELARTNAVWHPLASSNGKDARVSVGRETAEYIYRCARNQWLVEDDFVFVSGFLVRGDQFQYEGYTSELSRYQLPDDVALRARDV